MCLLKIVPRKFSLNSLKINGIERSKSLLDFNLNARYPEGIDKGRQNRK